MSHRLFGSVLVPVALPVLVFLVVDSTRGITAERSDLLRFLLALSIGALTMALTLILRHNISFFDTSRRSDYLLWVAMAVIYFMYLQIAWIYTAIDILLIIGLPTLIYTVLQFCFQSSPPAVDHLEL